MCRGDGAVAASTVDERVSPVDSNVSMGGKPLHATSHGSRPWPMVQGGRSDGDGDEETCVDVYWGHTRNMCKKCCTKAT